MQQESGQDGGWTHVDSHREQVPAESMCCPGQVASERQAPPETSNQEQTKRGFQSLASYDYGDDIQSCHTFEPRQRNIQKEIKYKQHHLA